MGHRVAGISPCVVLVGGWLVWFTLPGIVKFQVRPILLAN